MNKHVPQPPHDAGSVRENRNDRAHPDKQDRPIPPAKEKAPSQERAREQRQPGEQQPEQKADRPQPSPKATPANEPAAQKHFWTRRRIALTVISGIVLCGGAIWLF